MATELLKAHSSVSIDVNAERICSNMTNAKFGELVLDCRDDAVHMINLRLQDLRRWSLQDRTRAESWFGRCDDATRQRLIDGLTAISRVLKNLTPENFVRWDPLRATHISCSPNANNSFGAVAEVCAPDTVSHTIAIRDAFCEM